MGTCEEEERPPQNCDIGRSREAPVAEFRRGRKGISYSQMDQKGYGKEVQNLSQ